MYKVMHDGDCCSKGIATIEEARKDYDFILNQITAADLPVEIWIVRESDDTMIEGRHYRLTHTRFEQ